jgi:glycosyltransferase involved in cell wall biosynthesis
LITKDKLPVKFAGFLNQSRMASAYVAADALVLPSDGGETWGLVVNEAMACGLPCFVSDRVGCGPDMILPGETGAVFPLGDCEALARLLTQFAADQERMKRMGENSRRQANQYTLSVATERLLHALEVVTG